MSDVPTAASSTAEPTATSALVKRHRKETKDDNDHDGDD